MIKHNLEPNETNYTKKVNRFLNEVLDDRGVSKLNRYKYVPQAGENFGSAVIKLLNLIERLANEQGR